MRLHPGEVEASGWHVTTMPDVVRQLQRASPGVTKRPRVIAIDGRGGAGKSTMARKLMSVVPASAVVHTDDIAWHQAYFDWGQLLADGVLAPLHRGEAVHFQPPAWPHHGRRGAISIPAGLDAVWVEGTGVIRQELASWIDASVYVQGDLRELERRLLARDGDSPAMREHVAAWLSEELPFLLAEQPWRRATLVVDGPSALDDDHVVLAARTS